MNHKKMMSTAAGLSKFFSVMQKLCIAAAAVMILAAAAVAVAYLSGAAGETWGSFDQLDLEMLTIRFAPGFTPDAGAAMRLLWFTVIIGSLSAGVIVYAFGQLRGLMVPMQQGNPFCDASCACLRKLSYCALALGIIGNVGKTVTTAALMGTFQVSQLAVSEKIISVEPRYAFDLTFLAVFFLLLLMRYVFRYGAELQQLSDETL